MTDDALIKPVREKNEPALPAKGLLYINPGDAHRISTLLKTSTTTSHFLFNSRLATISDGSGNDFFVAGPAVGAPMAVMALEKLIALGARKVVIYGWCGSLTKELEIGSLLLPTWGIPGEGTSAYYPTAEEPASSDRIRQFLAAYFAEKKIAHTSGPVWTTDAVYRETGSKLAELAARSIKGVDMEFTALARVATFRKIELAAVFLVSDALWGQSWVPGFQNQVFKRMNKLVSAELLNAVKQLKIG